jgi:hypothetical protein
MNTLLPSLEIDLAASQLVQAALIRDGVHGLVLMGTVGEGNSLSAQEKHSVLAGGSWQAITPSRRRCRPGTSRLDGPTRNFEFQTWSVVSSCAFNCVDQDITPPGRYPLDFPYEVGSIQPTSMPSTSRRLSAATTSIPMSLSS